MNTLLNRVAGDPRPTIELQTLEGLQVPLRVTFRQGEIHIDPRSMEKGEYQLVFKRGKEFITRQFSVR